VQVLRQRYTRREPNGPPQCQERTPHPQAAAKHAKVFWSFFSKKNKKNHPQISKDYKRRQAAALL
jgi:hypothetical protein